MWYINLCPLTSRKVQGHLKQNLICILIDSNISFPLILIGFIFIGKINITTVYLTDKDRLTSNFNRFISIITISLESNIDRIYFFYFLKVLFEIWLLHKLVFNPIFSILHWNTNPITLRVRLYFSFDKPSINLLVYKRQRLTDICI
jgi:hypothetical protein